MARKKLIAGNWKMNTTLNGAKALAQGVRNGVVENPEVLVALCPPFPWLTAVGEVIRGTAIGLGAQNCHYEKDGAFTGEVSPTMLVDAGCRAGAFGVHLGHLGVLSG